jgi:hypothetical protein
MPWRAITMTPDSKHDAGFFTSNARFILPVPWTMLSAMNIWEAVHTGNAARYLPALGFAGLALLMYLGQRHIHQKRQAS